jgi:hypothetical protein
VILKYTILFIALLLLVGIVCAAPTTQAVTDITAGKVTFSATGGAGEGWFKWGTQNGYNYFWATPNQSVSGAFTDYQEGIPMLSGRTYHVVACDSTVCGNDVSFVVPPATTLAQTNYSAGTIVIMRSGLNLTKSLPIMVTPLTSQLGFWTWALLFFFIFSGWWLRQGDITIPMMISIVFGFTIWGAGAIGAGMGIPPDVMNIGIGLIIASVAGLFFSLFSK